MDPYPEYQLPNLQATEENEDIPKESAKKPLSSVEMGVIVTALAIAGITLCLLFSLVRGR